MGHDKWIITITSIIKIDNRTVQSQNKLEYDDESAAVNAAIRLSQIETVVRVEVEHISSEIIYSYNADEKVHLDLKHYNEWLVLRFNFHKSNDEISKIFIERKYYKTVEEAVNAVSDCAAFWAGLDKTEI